MATGNPAARWAATQHSPEVVDRVLLGLCAAIWLVLLGLGVAASVALFDLGRGFHTPTSNPHTGVLYIVIGVSALIILAAIPVLLRARQSAAPRRPAGPPAQAQSRQAMHGSGAGRSAARRGAGRPNAGLHRAEVDRVLLRGLIDLTSVVGAGLAAVAAATYLMAVGNETAAWVGYGTAGAIAAAMPVVPWLHLRQLRGVLATPTRFH